MDSSFNAAQVSASAQTGRVTDLNAMANSSVRAMAESVERLHSVHAVSLKVAETQGNFRMILQARIDGVKMITDLTRSAIQKSGAS